LFSLTSGFAELSSPEVSRTPASTVHTNSTVGSGSVIWNLETLQPNTEVHIDLIVGKCGRDRNPAAGFLECHQSQARQKGEILVDVFNVSSHLPCQFPHRTRLAFGNRPQQGKPFGRERLAQRRLAAAGLLNNAVIDGPEGPRVLKGSIRKRFRTDISRSDDEKTVEREHLEMTLKVVDAAGSITALR
jgi:hypothetical protein